MTQPFKFAVRKSRVFSSAEWREMARRAESLGYHSFLMSDHVAGPGPAMEKTGHPPGGLAVAPALMAVADATTELRVGTRVSCIDYHHPVVLAKEFATIDVLSDGRVEVGLGAGWLGGEYEALGIQLDPAGERIERLREATALLKLLFQKGTMNFHGKHYHVEGFEGQPQPIQRPHPPIAIGGGSRRVLQLAGSEANIVSLNYDNRSGLIGSFGVQSGRAEDTAQKLQWIREGAGDRFDDIEIEIGIYFGAVTSDPITAAEDLGNRFGIAASEIMDHPHVLFGSVDHICDEIVRRRELFGISYVAIPEELGVAFAPVVQRLAGK